MTMRTLMLMTLLAISAPRMLAAQSGGEAPTSSDQGGGRSAYASLQERARGRADRETEHAGDPISIQVKDADLRDVLEMIQEVSGREIVVDPSVPTKLVTFQWRDVPWDLALANLLESGGLHQATDGNVIRVFPADDAARTTLAKARLAIDLGDHEEALALLSSVVSDEAVSRELRCEARVRKAALLAQDGRRREANIVFKVAFDHCHDQPEAMRLLAQAVTGVAQDPATWRGRSEQLVLEFASTSAMDDAEPRITYVTDMPRRPVDDLPADGEPWEPMSFTGEPVSISMRNADFVDILRLFSTFSGMSIDLAPEALPFAKPISMEFADVPWDQALHVALQTNRLRAVKVGGGLRIEPLAEAGVTSSP